MKHHNQITFLPNRHRAAALRAFRELVEQYFERSERDESGIPLDWEGARAARSRINQMLPRIVQIVRAAGLTGLAGGPAGGTVPPLARPDLLLRIFSARQSPGVDQDVLDLLDMARGVYDGDRVSALARTINPFHYAGKMLAFLAGAPRALFAALRGVAGREGPGLQRPDIARLEAAVSRMAEIEALIDTRFADLQDRYALRNEEHNRQLVELAERLDFAERLLVQRRAVERIEPPEQPRVVTPV